MICRYRFLRAVLSLISNREYFKCVWLSKILKGIQKSPKKKNVKGSGFSGYLGKLFFSCFADGHHNVS